MALRNTLASILRRDDPPPRKRTADDFLNDLLGDPFGPTSPEVDRSPFAKAKKPIPTKSAEVGGSLKSVLGNMMKPTTKDTPLSMMAESALRGPLEIAKDVTSVKTPQRLSQPATSMRASLGPRDALRAAPEPSDWEKISTTGASWITPVDIPLLVEGGKNIVAGGAMTEPGQEKVALSLAGALPFGLLARELRGAKAAGNVVSDVARGGQKLERAEFQIPRILGDSVAGRTIKGLLGSGAEHAGPASSLLSPIPGTAAGKVIKEVLPPIDRSWAKTHVEKAVAGLRDPVRAADLRAKFPPVKPLVAPLVDEEMNDRGLQGLVDEGIKNARVFTPEELRAHLEANPMPPDVSEDLVAPFPLYSPAIRGVNASQQATGTPKFWLGVLKNNARQAEIDETGVGAWLNEQPKDAILTRRAVANKVREGLPEFGHGDRGFTSATEGATEARRAERAAYDKSVDDYDELEIEAMRVLQPHDFAGADALQEVVDGKGTQSLARLGLSPEEIATVQRYAETERPIGPFSPKTPKPKDIIYPNQFRLPGKEIRGTEGDLVTTFVPKKRKVPAVGEKVQIGGNEGTVLSAPNGQNLVQVEHFKDGWKWRTWVDAKELTGEAIQPFTHEGHTPGVKNPMVFSRVGEQNVGGKRVLASADLQSDAGQQAQKSGWKDETYPQRAADAIDKRDEAEKEIRQADKDWADLRGELMYSPVGRQKYVDMTRRMDDARTELEAMIDRELDARIEYAKAMGEPIEDEMQARNVIKWDLTNNHPEAKRLHRESELSSVGADFSDWLDEQMRAHPKMLEIINKSMDLQDIVEESNRIISRPAPGHFPAPMRKGNGMAEMGLMRLLHEGNQRGVDFSVLPTGKQANEMFGYGKLASEFRWNPDTGRVTGVYKDPNHSDHIETARSRKALAELIGEERVALMLTKPRNAEGEFVLSGDDIDAIKGHGMTAYYGNKEYYNPASAPDADAAKLATEEVAALEKTALEWGDKIRAATAKHREAILRRNSIGRDQGVHSAAFKEAEDDLWAASRDEDEIRVQFQAALKAFNAASGNLPAAPEKPVRGNIVSMLDNISKKTGVPMKFEGLPGGATADMAQREKEAWKVHNAAQDAVADAENALEDAKEALRAERRKDPNSPAFDAAYKVMEEAQSNWAYLQTRYRAAANELQEAVRASSDAATNTTIVGNPAVEHTPAVRGIKKWPWANIAITTGLGGVAGSVLSKNGLVPKDTTVKEDPNRKARIAKVRAQK